jgi:hypothetical protein
MKTGFITFCTEDYVPIIDNLVDSVLKFSKNDITVYSINFEYKHKNSRVKNKNIKIDKVTYYNICKVKILASVDCEYDYCLVLDGDMIVTKDIDKIFEENEEKIKNLDFPLFAKHPHNPFENELHKENIFNLIARYTKEKPKMKYVFASYLFTNESKWFLKEVLNEMEILGYTPGDDEFVINALLTKYQVDYDIGYNYLPHASEDIIDSYLEDNLSNCKDLYESYFKYDCPVKFYIFHGIKCKDVKYSRELIKKMENKK